MKVLLQCIYTFETNEQVMIDFGKLPNIALENEKNFIAYAKMGLTTTEESDLIKISACVMTETPPPNWFMECGGKFYLKEF